MYWNSILGIKINLVILAKIISLSIYPFWTWGKWNFWGVGVYAKFKIQSKIQNLKQNSKCPLTFYILELVLSC